MSEYRGLLFIGDPHLRSRNPSGRIDDYATVTIGKLEWAIQYARRESLLPCILGDFFEDDYERSLNLVGDLCASLAGQLVLAIFGNHDTKEKQLTGANALMVPVKAGLLKLVSGTNYWQGLVGGREVIVGGSSYSEIIPSRFEAGYPASVTTFWMTHHQVEFGTGDGDIVPYQIDGVEFVVNGHLHHPRESIRIRKTTWFNPGALARNRRSDHWSPRLLRFDPIEKGFASSWVEVPHAPYETVFGEPPEKVAFEEETDFGGEFVKGLKALVRTGGSPGEGLMFFLQNNRESIEPEVFREIELLAQEVMPNVQ